KLGVSCSGMGCMEKLIVGDQELMIKFRKVGRFVGMLIFRVWCSVIFGFSKFMFVLVGMNKMWGLLGELGKNIVLEMVQVN
uniref:hypothetical protein n=1 Tax=Neisseria sicca TaxID=490 RepID=UPI001C993153